MITFDQFISKNPEKEDYDSFFWLGPCVSSLTIKEVDKQNKLVFMTDGTLVTFAAMKNNFRAVRVLKTQNRIS